MRRFFAAARVLMGLALVVAVAGRLQAYLRFWVDRGDRAIAVDVANFFSYFTIQTSLFHAVVFAIGARFLFARRGADPQWLGALRAAATTYTVTTGVVYNALLRGLPQELGLEQPWANEVLHTIVPVYALLDWLLAPGRGRVRWRTVGGIVVYPVLWAAYTLVRAPFVLDEGTGNPWWYPYPFLDPNESAGGYGSVAVWVGVLAVAITATASVLVGISRRRPGSPGEDGGERSR
ncbi:Pr6Pr family membrane protein [Kocuria nitroreducens]|uniref:Pr6Pr family membrane protein n=1 Tax=Kocuria nitroreducens TaxID=3058914 RepID=UPI0036DC038E